jgi:IS4 transposase
MAWTPQARRHCWRKGLQKQVFSVVGRRRIERRVREHQADKWCKKFFAVDHLRLAMALVLLPFRSLRGLAVAVEPGRLLNRGGEKPLVSRSSLIDAFAHRSWRFFAAVYQDVVEAVRQRALPPGPGPRRRARSVKIIDATTLPLIHRLVGVFLGTRGRAAAKLNVRIDEPTRLPESLVVTAGRCHERRTVDRLIDWSQAGITYLFDRGYFCRRLFERLMESGNYFVTLLKEGVTVWPVYEQKRFRGRWQEGFRLLRDSVVEMAAPGGSLLLRLVEAFDEEGHHWKVLTNHFSLSALEVCVLYRQRWAVENFFRTLKRQLRLREYAVANANAVMIIILCTLMAYCLAQALVFGANEPMTLAEAIQVLQTLSASVFAALEHALLPFASRAAAPNPPPAPVVMTVAFLLAA